MANITSSHAVIRALKGIEDPPTPGGPSKIEIARKAWESTDIHFPSKDEVLSEWILTSFIKNSKESGISDSRGLIFSSEYWGLLSNILNTTSSQGSRPNRTWLSGLCIRVSLLNILTIFFKCTPLAEPDHLQNVIEPFVRSIHVVWPQAAVRMTLDALMDCFRSMLQCIASESTLINQLATVCLLITRAFKQAVGNTTGKKKAFSSFMEQSFLHWTHVACLDSSSPIVMNREAKLLMSEVYQAGIDVFFCLDALKSSNNPLDAIITDTKYLPNIQTSQYRIVPMLYRSYVQELRKHRYAVFGSGSSQTQEHTIHNKLRDTGMRAFGACYKVLKDFGGAVEAWKSVLVLVEALEEANLVGYGLTESTGVLNDIAVSSVQVLTEAQDDNERTETVVQSLCSISRIDFDFFSPLLPDVLSALLMMNPKIYPSTLTLLRIVLDFYSNTRTMPSYLSLLFGAFSSRDIARPALDAQQMHQLCTSGVLLSLAHLNDLSRCIRGFLTPGQTQSVVDSSLETLGDTWKDCLEQVDIEHSAMDTDTTEVSVEHAALRYSLIARAIAVVLPSLPFSSLSETTTVSVLESVFNIWKPTLCQAARGAFTESKSPGDDWATQCVSAATLRIRHALLTCPALCGPYLREPSIATIEDIVRRIQVTTTLPELVIELFRTFFDVEFLNASVGERASIIGALVTYLESNLDLSGQETPEIELTWDGSSSSLNLLGSESRKRGALALCHLVFDRWLPIIDETASKEQLVHITRLLFTQANASVDVTTKANQISFSWLSNRVLCSAGFWELQNIKDALISNIDSMTQHASWEDFSSLSKRDQTPALSGETWTTEQVQSILAVFRLLLRAPREYIPRDTRLIFVRRALVSDRAVSCHGHDSSKDVAILSQTTEATIRSWIISVSDIVDNSDIISANFRAYVEYLMSSVLALDDLENDFREVTLDLLSVLFRQTIRSAVQNKSDHLISLCELFQRPSSGISEQARLRFVEILVVECPNANKLGASCIGAITELCSAVQAEYSDALSTSLESTPEITSEQGLIVHSWRTSVVLQKWLNKRGQSEVGTGIFGFQLLQKIMPADRYSSSNDEVRSYCTNVLLLLLEELDILDPEERERHISSTAAAYILSVGRLRFVDQSECGEAFGSTFKSLSVNEFDHVLSLLREGLEKGLRTNAETRAAVHLSSIFIGDAPEGTMKVMQEHFEACLDIFCCQSKYESGDLELTLEVLGFIGKFCSEKPAYLRYPALRPIWLLLAKLLTGSTTHAQETCFGILHSIVSIAGSIIRLRRDLITSTLPHLGMVLSSLLRSLRAPRGQLGARQRTQVADTLPWWVAPSAPLGVAEGRAVARLLTSLQAKTIPRTFTHKGKEKERTAESLLVAFSKHAAPVLGTYINMLVDPLVAVDSPIREVLASGLYVLCEAMGEHGRDSLMASGCDAAGRTVFKALWKDYDKQRYVGKG